VTDTPFGMKNGLAAGVGTGGQPARVF
jgi:hypothetical protein